jgi:hypothetical protein
MTGNRIAVVSLALLCPVKCPIIVQITTGSERADLEHSFRPFQSPTSSGQVHPVLDQMSASTLYDPGGDGKTLFEEEVVMQQGLVFLQIVPSFLHCLALLAAQLIETLTKCLSHARGFSLQDLESPFGNPVLSLLASRGT